MKEVVDPIKDFGPRDEVAIVHDPKTFLLAHFQNRLF